jgi:hypothetical protein
MIQKSQPTKKKKMKFDRKEDVAKAFMDTKVTELYNRLNIISLTIIPSGKKDCYDLMYVYEDNK